MSTFYVDFFEDLSFENEKEKKMINYIFRIFKPFLRIIKNHFQINLLFIHLNIRIATIMFRLERHWYHVVFKN